MVVATAAAAALALSGAGAAEAPPLVCLDPGHGGRTDRTEPIGPGSSVRKAADSGGTAGEPAVVLRIGLRTRSVLVRRGFRVAMTRTGPRFSYGRGGNADRARFCNRRRAALVLRIHADGSTDRGRHGVSTFYPARRRGWTDDVHRPSLRAARLVQRAVVAATGAASRGVVPRGDLTGFNWSNVPSVLVETGFMTNRAERARLRSARYQRNVARGLANGATAFLR